MTLTKKFILALLITVVLFALACVVGLQVYTANANTSGFIRKSSDGSFATTTLTYMTPGTATSTLVMDLGPTTAADGAAVLVQFSASSTNSSLQINQEYAQGVAGVDCTVTPTACDWYQSSQPNILQNSTTTIAVSLQQVPQYVWQFASSTSGLGAVPTNNNRDTRTIMVNSPTRYTRLVFSLKLGGTNGAVWSEVVGKKQNPQ